MLRSHLVPGSRSGTSGVLINGAGIRTTSSPAWVWFASISDSMCRPYLSLILKLDECINVCSNWQWPLKLSKCCSLVPSWNSDIVSMYWMYDVCELWRELIDCHISKVSSKPELSTSRTPYTSESAECKQKVMSQLLTNYEHLEDSKEIMQETSTITSSSSFLG